MSERPTDVVPERRRGGTLSQRLAALERQAPAPATPALPPPGRRRGFPVDVARWDVPRWDVARMTVTRIRAEHAERRRNEFTPGILDISETPHSPATGRVVLLLVVLLVTAFAWSYFGIIGSDTTAAGRVQAAGRTKVLESPDKGQVTKILTQDGAKVKKGQILVELDPTEALAARTIVFDKLADARAENARRGAEIMAARLDPVVADPEISWSKDIADTVRRREEDAMHARLTQLASALATLTSQKVEKEAERDGYVARIAAQKALVAITQENLTMIDQLTQMGWNSRAKYLDMKAQLQNQQVAQTSLEGGLADIKQVILTIESQIAKTRETFVTDDIQAAAANEQSIIDLTQRLVKADKTLANMTLRAPVAGRVHASAVTTIGQVVKAGDQLMQIVPDDAPLEIQAYIDNASAGFIRVGQDATIKVTAFPYSTYGSVDGTVVNVAKDALAATQKNSLQSASLDGEYSQTTAAQKTGALQFPVIVRAKKNSINVDGREVPLVPGMSVSVELVTEDRRAIDYVVSPILELFSTAAHEK